MKKNDKLIHLILKFIENSEHAPRASEVVIKGFDQPAVLQHLELLIDELGFLKAIDASSFDGADYLAIELTGVGHYRLDSLKEQASLSKLTSPLKALLVHVGFPVVAAVLGAWALSKFYFGCTI